MKRKYSKLGQRNNNDSYEGRRLKPRTMHTPEDKYVRNEEDKADGRSAPLGRAFKHAFQGLVYTAQSQRNMKIYLSFSLLAILLGIILSITALQWLAILTCIALVFTAECINTAIESLVDLVSPEYSDLAKRSKDCAAAAVLVSAFCSLVVALCVYGGAIVNILAPGLLPL